MPNVIKLCSIHLSRKLNRFVWIFVEKDLLWNNRFWKMDLKERRHHLCQTVYLSLSTPPPPPLFKISFPNKIFRAFKIPLIRRSADLSFKAINANYYLKPNSNILSRVFFFFFFFFFFFLHLNSLWLVFGKLCLFFELIIFKSKSSIFVLAWQPYSYYFDVFWRFYFLWIQNFKNKI